jgi:peptide/nickel transport system substrate-binding protein
MPERFRLLVALCIVIGVMGCGSKLPPPQTVTMLIESSPTSLDPRIGVDAQSEHI